MKLDGAIFDMDGTLVDSMGYWKSVAGDYIRGLGKEPDPDIGSRFLSLGLSNIYPQMVKDYGLTQSIDEVSSKIYEMMEKNYETVVAKPFVKDMLEAFKQSGVKMCIASATNASLAKKVLKQCGILEYFDAVFCCKDVGRGKRYPDIYNYALNYLGTDKDKTPVFEDAAFAVTTLHNNGFVSVGIEDDNCSEEEKATVKELSTYYIDSYANWEKILK